MTKDTGSAMRVLHLLLLHQLCIGTVIYHAFAKDWGAKRAVDLFRTGVFQLGIEDELVALLAQAYGRLLPE